jgi:hypothetical protein
MKNIPKGYFSVLINDEKKEHIENTDRQYQRNVSNGGLEVSH